MKALLLVGVFISYLLFLPLGARAQRTNVKPLPGLPHVERVDKLEKRLEKKELIHERIKKASEKREEKRATRAARLAEKRKVRIRAFFARLTKRLNAAITRLERLIARIESRLAKIAAEEDVAISSIQADINEAKGLLEEAQATLGAASDSFESVLSSDEPKEAFQVIRDTIHEVKGLLVKTHRILVHVIGDIKGLRVGAEKKPSTATSSSSTTP